MELRQLKYFIAVAEELHFRNAAQRLNISQPPLSRQIRRLEEDIKVHLFVRNKRGVSLTPAGKRFLPYAKNILKSIDLAAEVARQGNPKAVTLGFVSSASMLLPPVLRRVRETHPTIELKMIEAGSQRQKDMIRAGELDIALVRGPWSCPGVISEAVQDDDLSIILANDHPRATDSTLKLADLAAEPFVFFPRELGPGFFDTVMSACNQAGFAPELTQVAGSTLTIIALVAAGQGYSLMPTRLATSSRGVTVRRPQDLTAQTQLSIAYPEGRESWELTASIVHAFKDLAASAYERN